jgi:hypothetical protein
MAQRRDGVGGLASACLRRGYGIEQEASVRGAQRRLLAGHREIRDLVSLRLSHQVI